MKQVILMGCAGVIACGAITYAWAQGSKAEVQDVALGLRRVERIIKRAIEDGDRATVKFEQIELSKLIGKISGPDKSFGSCPSAASALYNIAIDFTSPNGPLPTSVRRSTENFNRWMPECEKLAGIRTRR